jgi:hypothetical protein
MIKGVVKTLVFEANTIEHDLQICLTPGVSFEVKNIISSE